MKVVDEGIQVEFDTVTFKVKTVRCSTEEREAFDRAGPQSMRDFVTRRELYREGEPDVFVFFFEMPAVFGQPAILFATIHESDRASQTLRWARAHRERAIDAAFGAFADAQPAMSLSPALERGH